MQSAKQNLVKGLPAKKEATKAQEILKKQTITLSLQKEGQLDNKIKDLNSALKIKAEKVELILDTVFDSDKMLLTFCTVLVKVSSSINYLKWKIGGIFSDEQAKSIGDAIGRMGSAYRIELILNRTFFADAGAKSLSNAFKKLKNLRVLNFQLRVLHGKIYNQITEAGIGSLKSAMQQMDSCSIIESNLWRNQLGKIQKCQSNLSFDLVEDLSFDFYEGDCNNWIKVFDYFLLLISEFKNRITQVKLGRCQEKFEVYSKEAFFSEEEYGHNGKEEKGLFLYKQIESLFNLPYITEFQYSFDPVQVLANKPDSQYALLIDIYNRTLTNLANFRYSQIAQILIFQQQIKQLININPALVLVDLYIQ